MAPRQPRDSDLRWEGVVLTKVLPDLSPLRALVDATAGELAAFEAQVDPTLTDLAGRWHLWFQAPDAKDGRLRPVQVRLRDGQALRTRAWLRSSTPEGLAEARLRRLLEDERLDRDLSLKAGLAETRLELRLEPFTARDPSPPAPVRISIAFARPDGSVEIRHVTAPGVADPAKGWSHTLPVQVPAAIRELAVIAEDLARERWGAAVVEAGPP